MFYQKEVKMEGQKWTDTKDCSILNWAEREVIKSHVSGLFKILFQDTTMKNEMTNGDSSTSLFHDFSDTAFMSRLFQDYSRAECSKTCDDYQRFFCSPSHGFPDITTIKSNNYRIPYHILTFSNLQTAKVICYINY